MYANYPERMTDEEVLELFREGKYSLNQETLEISNKRGKVLTPYSDSLGYQVIRLYSVPKRRGITVHRLVWMVVTDSLIPENFEIHHADTVTHNNQFSNLFCLHQKDHNKIHQFSALYGKNEEVPF